ncbi:MAG: hypothetical protein JWM27_131 [Gemmatimonadetes bacterium]|nr:hypothetical protein [Gemmatimonadota bacterium]
MSRARPIRSRRGTLAAAGVALALATGSASAQSVPAGPAGTRADPVVVDGVFGDWDGVPSAAVEQGAASPASPVRLREVRIRHDAGNVFIYFDFGRPVVAQGLTGTVKIVLDADGDPSTGATVDGVRGADVAILLSPRIRGGSGAVSTLGVGVARLGAGAADANPLPADTAGVVLAPSYASQRFELRIARGGSVAESPMLFTGTRIVGRVVALDPAGAVAAQTGIFAHALTAGPARPVPAGMATADPLARAPGTVFRLLSWNVNGSGLPEHSEPFRRALAALRPDIIMLDEVPAGARAAVDSLLASLPSAAGAGPWHVVFGAAGGRQHGVVASRLPVEASAALAHVAYPDSLADALRGAPASVAADISATEGVPTVGALVTVDGRRVLVATVDLKCCGGGIGTPEERVRRIEARAMADAVRRAVSTERPDAVVVAGDYNLVGTAQPLETMREGTDVDGSSLFVADAPRLDGLSYATWTRPRNRFAPGRLDFHLYGDEALRPARSFAFDTRDLSPAWLSAHALRADDSGAASGHRPVVTDFAWTPGGRR